MGGPTESRGWETDVLSAVALAEGAIADRILVALDGRMDLPATNVFGNRVEVERFANVAALVPRLVGAKSKGERVAVVARAADLAAARSELARAAEARLGVVVHAMIDGVDEAASFDMGLGPAFALADLPWGMLIGAGAGDAADLTLIARRAAEDSRFPFLVVHPHGRPRSLAPSPAPSHDALAAFFGSQRTNGSHDPGAGEPAEPGAFHERVPFALASAIRDLEGLTGRRREVIERAPKADCALALVGAGVLGESLLAEVEGLRASGHDVGAVRVVAWRPFPAARLVRSLSRALAMTVLDGPAPPSGAMSTSGPLATYLKAAFADALTWAPDYPGIGSIPRIVSGLVAFHRELDPGDAEAMVRNMMRNDLGKRSFVLGGSARDSLE